MCLHSAYEAGGVVYVRGLDARPARETDSNIRSSRAHDDVNHPIESEQTLRGADRHATGSAGRRPSAAERIG